MERIRAVEFARHQETAAIVHRRATLVPFDRSGLQRQRVVFPDDSGPAAHAFRMLRTQLLHRIRLHQVRTLGVVSAIDGEGKTLTAVNLAMSLAGEPNQTVLLMDLDLRKPRVASMLGLSNQSAGLEAWFAGQCPVGELFVGIEGIERLRILPTHAPVPASSSHLASARTRALFEELKTRYDDRLVVLDLPPALLTDDVLTVAPCLDAVIVVVAEGHTNRDDLERMRELLGSVRMLGSVLNHASESERRAY